MIAPNSKTPIVNDKGQMQQQFRLFVNALVELDILTGSGSPEGVVVASPKRLYMDTTGSAGSILYIKRDVAIGGDRSQGWILV